MVLSGLSLVPFALLEHSQVVVILFAHPVRQGRLPLVMPRQSAKDVLLVPMLTERALNLVLRVQQGSTLAVR